MSLPPDETPEPTVPPDETPEPTATPEERPVPWEIRRRTGGRAGTVFAASSFALVIALWGITVAGRNLRAPPAGLAVAVTVLPYLYLGLAAWLFALWAALPDRRSLPALLALVVLSGGILWGPSWPARAEIAEGTPVRVLTWNVRRLWGGPEDGGDPVGCVVDTVQAQEPDLVALLEVSAEDVRVLEQALDLHCVHTDYQASGSVTAGGLAACARGSRWRLVGGEPQPYLDVDDWRFVFSEMEQEGRVLNLLAVHLFPYYPRLSRSDVREGVRDLAQGEPKGLIGVGRSGEEVIRHQGAQSTALLGRVGRFHDPTLVVGDFNSTRDAALHTALRKVLVDAWERGGVGFGATTHLGGWLPLRIDYVYATDAFAVRGARVVPRDCSDHRPVVADLVLRDVP